MKILKIFMKLENIKRESRATAEENSRKAKVRL